MGKINILLLAVFLVLSCQKKEGLVIDKKEVPVIDKNDTQTVKVKQTDDIIENEYEESKPLVIVTKDDTLIIMVRSDGAPGMFVGDDGKLYGFYVDLERMVMKEMGQAYRLVPYKDVGPVQNPRCRVNGRSV